MPVESFETAEVTEVLDAVVKAVTAFANGNGGRIRIHLNEGNAEDAVCTITERLRSSVKPAVLPGVHFSVKKEGVVTAEIEAGTARPYYLSNRGLMGGGVCVREGNTTVSAPIAAVRQMLEKTGASFEERRSLNQRLSFEAASEAFAVGGISLDAVQERHWGMVDENGEYTNLGWLLSDQCDRSVKMAHFSGKSVTSLTSCREYKGSLLAQTQALLKDLKDFVHTTSLKGSEGGRADYPESAVREALINMMVHRDYSSDAQGTVSVFSDRIEFLSAGGLCDGVTEDDLCQGLSKCRNKKLAAVFEKLRFMTAYGIGLRIMTATYEDCPVKPAVTVTQSMVRVTLPNRNGAAPVLTSSVRETAESAVRRWAGDRGAFSRSELDDFLHCSVATSNRLLKRLLGDCVLVQTGRGRNTRYRLNRGGTEPVSLTKERLFPENYNNVFEYLLDHGPTEPLTGFTELCNSEPSLDFSQEIFQ